MNELNGFEIMKQIFSLGMLLGYFIGIFIMIYILSLYQSFKVHHMKNFIIDNKLSQKYEEYRRKHMKWYEK